MNSLAARITAAEHGRTHLFAVGQAGFIIKSASGQLIGIDLYLSDCVERVEGHSGFKRLCPAPLRETDLVMDVLIATHFHRDHFDIDAMPGLMANGKTHLFCAADCAEDVEQLGLDKSRVTFVKPRDRHRAGDFDLRFIKCDHGAGAPQAVGVLLTVDGKTLLETGDTCLHEEWKDEYLCAGPPDILIAPINGAYGNLNETDCCKLAELLHPRLTIPCHVGMFAAHGGNPALFVQQMSKKAAPYAILSIGEGRAIE